MRGRRRHVPALALAGMAFVLATGAPAMPERPPPTIGVQIFAPRGTPGPSCRRVYPLPREARVPAVLSGAMRALLRGPTPAERTQGYGGWFSAKTAGMFRTARVVNGVAYVDFENFSRVIPGASTSCDSALLLAQLDRTAKYFPWIRRTVYSFSGSVRSFYEWLQRPPPRG